MESIALNDNDSKLLELCRNKKSVGELSKLLNIAPKNVSVRIKRLEEAGLISVERRGQGKKTYVKTKATDQTKKFKLEILSQLKQKKEGMSFEDFVLLPGFKPNFFQDPDGLDKANANRQLMYSDMIERKIFITEAGKKFLEDNEVK